MIASRAVEHPIKAVASADRVGGTGFCRTAGCWSNGPQTPRLPPITDCPTCWLTCRSSTWCVWARSAGASSTITGRGRPVGCSRAAAASPSGHTGPAPAADNDEALPLARLLPFGGSHVGRGPCRPRLGRSRGRRTGAGLHSHPCPTSGAELGAVRRVALLEVFVGNCRTRRRRARHTARTPSETRGLK